MTANDILDFWFSDRVKQKWWEKDETFDAEIRSRFLDLYTRVLHVDMYHWEEHPRSILALIILMDQFPRNMFRGKPESYVTDDYAVDLCKKAIIQGFDEKFTDEEKIFLYIPLMHSEDIKDQELSVELYEKAGLAENHKFAILHMDVIKEYGRFPHRNKILGRKNTPEEEVYLQDPNAGF